MSLGENPREFIASSNQSVTNPVDSMEYPLYDIDENAYFQNILYEGEGELEGEKPFSYFDLLDRPRILPDPSVLNFEHLTQIGYELGLIRLCWPEIMDEERIHFHQSYLNNTNKEKLLLLYTENFRQQFFYKHPNRKPLFLACDNECGVQKMVCTAIRPTTLSYHELESWDKLVKFVGDHLTYDPHYEATLIVSTNINLTITLLP